MISVIVPIYNVEKQLKKCIDSILNQEDTDLQIILVNDGSTDNSGLIAKQYFGKFPNKIVYLEKENGGLSDARNYGLKYATGDYISFVDSDDFIQNNLYKNLQKYIDEKYDVIKFKIQKVDIEGKIIEKINSPDFDNKTGEEAFNILYKIDNLLEVAWGYLYKKSFFYENNFKYEKDLYHEDFGLTPLILVKAKKVVSVPVLGYNYVQTTNSITRGNEETTHKRALDLLKHYDNMITKIRDYNISQETKENLKIYYTNCIILAINNINDENKKNEYIKKIKQKKLIKNIKVRNFKQLIKKIILLLNIKWYLKIR